jgi:glutathione S-transferase
MQCILHHFDLSPFAEKARLALGLKGLAWHAVDIPLVMPKPDLTALTGGYRKTPVLQIGADIYCDTQRIALELERRWPDPSLFPDGSSGLCLALSHWSDGAFFRPGAALSLGTNADLPGAIVNDRRAFFTFMNFDTLAQDLPHHYAAFRAQLQRVESMLADGRRFLLGEAPSWADILAYFPVWMCRGNIADSETLLAPLLALQGWAARVAALGHGRCEPLAASDALRIAQAATPIAAPLVLPDAYPRLALEAAVIVTPDDYGAVPVHGALWRLTHDEVAVRREDPRIGQVVVHFPRIGYRVEAA